MPIKRSKLELVNISNLIGNLVKGMELLPGHIEVKSVQKTNHSQSKNAETHSVL